MITAQQIASDVATGLQIKAEIARLKKHLDEIEDRLEQAALHGEQIPLEDEDREGRQYLALGEEMLVPVRLESDLIAASFPLASPMHKAVLTALGLKDADENLYPFFKQSITYQRDSKDGHQFRKIARSNLDPKAAAALISASIMRNKDGIPKSKTVVAWDDAKPITTTISTALPSRI